MSREVDGIRRLINGWKEEPSLERLGGEALMKGIEVNPGWETWREQPKSKLDMEVVDQVNRGMTRKDGDAHMLNHKARMMKRMVANDRTSRRDATGSQCKEKTMMEDRTHVATATKWRTRGPL